MVSMAAQLLDELMGRHRNTLPNENSKEPSYHDPDVCKHYTSVFCPHDLFTNTKADLGVCGKVHDDMVREKYQKDASAVTREQFEDDFIRYARQILGEVDKRIVKGKQRLQTQFPEKGSNDREGCEEKVVLLTDKINHLIEEAEKEGCEGNIEQAQGLLKLCDQLKEERDQFRKQLDGTAQNYQGVDPFAQEKQMEICTVCGAFLIIGDAQSRLDDHLQGKMHVGYTRLRSAIDEILEKRESERKEKEVVREKEREEWKKKREDRGNDEEERKKRRVEMEEERSKRDRESVSKRDRSRSRERYDRHSRGYSGGHRSSYGSSRNDYGRYDRGSYRSRSDYDRRDRRSRSRDRRRY
ncbi:luc7-like protein 3 [Artemia franciscana]|uniref:luc7-like protein 3 n=1 Tax=Artemia franciscana TaxID=6661 RepID=UPI0032D9F71E